MIRLLLVNIVAILSIDFNLTNCNIDIMDKWNLLQTLAHEKDEHLKENRITWKQFKRQLEELEQAATHFTNADTLRKFNKYLLFVLV